jgi:transcriptional regulator with GAF, ATPase, and Fis domain
MAAVRPYSASEILDRTAARLDGLRPLDAEAQGIVGGSEALRQVMHRVDLVAPTEATVLLTGETGTGKELLARAIHRRGARRDRPFVVVNCAALAASLIESELFGHERGAFTGAHAGQMGRFEFAQHGTVFLDEVGELPLELQPRLLRVIQEGQLERLGNPRTIDIDVRVIAATNRDLAGDVRRGQFRRDLYYRLNVFPIAIPALRERPADIAPLVGHLLERLCRTLNRRIDAIPPDVMRVLETYSWPGNVRELENVLHRAIIMSPGSVLSIADASMSAFEPVAIDESARLVDVERRHIATVLQASRWRIEGAGGAAQILGLKPSTLRSRMMRLGIARAR